MLGRFWGSACTVRMPRVKMEQGTSSSSSGNPAESAPSSTNHTDLSAAKAFSKSQTSVLEDYIYTIQ